MKSLAAISGLMLLASAVFADPPAQTRVNVTSQPSGATVIIDGCDRGTTPITLFDLAPGRHHLKCRLAGYVESDRFFKTGESPSVECNETLAEEKGLFLLRTEPEGCSILIDGVSAGQTPRLITHLAAKDTYSVRLRKAGCQDQVISVKFDGRKPLVRTETMVLASGVISIASEPSGADVTVNGIERGKTPVEVSGVPRGRATVKFHLDGFEDETRELAVNAGDRQTLQIVLKGLPGTLHLTSVPDGARFYVNEESRGKGPVTMTGLKPGDYTVRAELDGYGTQTKTVTIENGASLTEEFRLSNVMGRLEVRTSPVGAHLTFDGRPMGVTKASDPNAELSDVFAIENVSEGEHTLVVRKDGYSESVRHPKVLSEKTAQATVRLKRIFRPDTKIVTAHGDYVGVLVSLNSDYVVLEVKMGITRSFPRSEIRRMESIAAEK